MLLNDFWMQTVDWNAILRHVGAKMQFYKVKYAVKWFLNANSGLKCNFKTCGG